MLSILVLLPLIPSLVNLALVAYVFGQRRRSALNRAFMLYGLVVSLLTLLETVVYLPCSDMVTGLAARTASALALALGFVFLHFVYALTRRRYDAAYWSAAVAAVISGGFACSTDLLQAVHTHGVLMHTIRPTPMFALAFLVVDVLPGAYAVFLLLSRMRHEPAGAFRSQLRLITIGTLLSMASGIALVTVFPLVLNNPSVVRYSSLGVLIQTYFVYRAIRRYHLMSVNIEQIVDVSKRLFQNVREAILVIDSSGDLVELNDAAVQFFGRGPRRGLASKLSTRIEGYEAGGEFSNRQTRALRADGEWRSVLLSEAVIRESGTTHGSLVMMRDITADLEAERQLVRSRQLESLGVLAGGIAHDFNNFLTGIVSCLNLLQTDQSLSREQHDIVALGEDSALEAERLTRQLLTFAKGGAPTTEPFDLREVLSDNLSFCLRGSSVESTLDTDENLQFVSGDRGQVSQVVQNLLINAVQAMPDGGRISVTARNMTTDGMDSTPLTPGDYVEVTVADSGPGIAEEDLPRVFEPYYTTKSTGTGLGLTSAYSIIRRHGGHIDVDSGAGEGATFTVYLPATREAPDQNSDEPIPEFDCTGRILVMDDEPTIRVLLTRQLERLGFDVDAVGKGNEALQRLDHRLSQGDRYVGAILDLTIRGGMGGKELAGRIRERVPGMPIVVASGYSNDPVLADYTRHGFCCAVRKPYSGDALKRALGAMCRARHAGSQQPA